MAGKNRSAGTVIDESAPQETTADTGEEPTLDGMPQAPADTETDASAPTERQTVPKHLRPLFNEIARLSGFLALARRAVYEDAPERAVKALALVEGAAPAAREVAEISAR